MRYPVVIHKDENSDFGVMVPDIPGCYSAGDTYDEVDFTYYYNCRKNSEIILEGKEVNVEYPSSTLFGIECLRIGDYNTSDFRKIRWKNLDL